MRGSVGKVFSRVHEHNLHPRPKFTPGANLHPLASRSYAKKSCPYVPRFDLKFNTRYIVLWSNSLGMNVLEDSNPLLLRFYVCEGYLYGGVCSLIVYIPFI